MDMMATTFDTAVFLARLETSFNNDRGGLCCGSQSTHSAVLPASGREFDRLSTNARSDASASTHAELFGDFCSRPSDSNEDLLTSKTRTGRWTVSRTRKRSRSHSARIEGGTRRPISTPALRVLASAHMARC